MKKLFHKILALGIRDSCLPEFEVITLKRMRKDTDLDQYRIGGYRIRGTLTRGEYLKYTASGLWLMFCISLSFVVIAPLYFLIIRPFKRLV